MSDSFAPPQDRFDRLLDAMPRVAEAVNAFSSEEVQRTAFDALMGALGLPLDVTPTPAFAVEAPPSPVLSDKADEEIEEARSVEPDVAPVVAAKVAKAGPRRKRTAKKWEPIRDIDFRPEGKQALRDLVSEKEPNTIDQKNALAVYWLAEVAGIEEVGVGHVVAAYRECAWREPSNPSNALQVTASAKHWLDTKNMSAIVLTPSGRNLVLHDLPKKKAV